MADSENKTSSRLTNNLINCTIISIEMCNHLHGILTRDEYERLKNYATQHLNFEGATYLYSTIHRKIRGNKHQEKVFKDALELTRNLTALRKIEYSEEIYKDQPLMDFGIHISCSKVRYGFKVNAHKFIGRDNELKQLQDWWHGQRVCSKPLVVSGLGGIGKTYLVKEFVRAFAEHDNVNVLWLDSSRQHLQDSIFALLKPYTDTEDGINCCLLEQFVSKISSLERPTLLVLDDLEEFPIPTNIEFVANPPQNLFVIATSRNRNILPGKKEHLNLSVLTNPDAIEILRDTLPPAIAKNDKLLIDMCSLLQNFPLTLNEVAHYILSEYNNRRYDVNQFLEDFKCSETQREIFNGDRLLSNTKTISIWDKTVDLIFNFVSSRTGNESKGFKILLLLKVLSFGKYKSIKINEFYSLQHLDDLSQDGVWEKVGGKMAIESFQKFTRKEVQQGIHQLLHLSLLEYEDCTDSYSVHKLVQMVTRLKHPQRWLPSEIFRSNNECAQQQLRWNFPGFCDECEGYECPNVLLSE